MGATDLNPLGRHINFNATVSNTYPGSTAPQVDCSGNGFTARRVVIENLDSTNSVIFSLDGTNQWYKLGPGKGLMLDGVKIDKMWIKSSAGSPEAQVLAYA